jgi:hypothetical protein
MPLVYNVVQLVPPESLPGISRQRVPCSILEIYKTETLWLRPKHGIFEDAAAPTQTCLAPDRRFPKQRPSSRNMPRDMLHAVNRIRDAENCDRVGCEQPSNREPMLTLKLHVCMCVLCVCVSPPRLMSATSSR